MVGFGFGSTCKPEKKTNCQNHPKMHKIVKITQKYTKLAKFPKKCAKPQQPPQNVFGLHQPPTFPHMTPANSRILAQIPALLARIPAFFPEIPAHDLASLTRSPNNGKQRKTAQNCEKERKTGEKYVVGQKKLKNDARKLQDCSGQFEDDSCSFARVWVILGNFVYFGVILALLCILG